MSDLSAEAPHQSVSETNIDAGLERLGYRAFRIGQRRAVETLLAEDRLLLVAPTGGDYASIQIALDAGLPIPDSQVLAPSSPGLAKRRGRSAQQNQHHQQYW